MRGVMMRKSIEVLDDFLPDPVATRQAALGADWRPATASDGVLWGTLFAPAPPDEETADRVQQLMRPGQQNPSGRLDRSYFVVASDEAPAPGVSRLTHDEWTAVIWLCRGDRDRGGVSFVQALGQSAGDNGGTPAEQWEETMFVSARFNRAVLIGPSTFFRIIPGLGADPGSGQLAQVVLSTAVSVE